ncbi:hypothetical protein [Yimella sp. cx-51]|uniref:hypothetical protein n=1 Tax=Yimella sp. cx-51 TaxID=2770551 RepID=UPI002729FBFE|nr:hypothetical protein [Yimella sp. cx-51]
MSTALHTLLTAPDLSRPNTGVNWTALTILIVIFLAVTVMGFLATHWRKADSMESLDEWGLGGRSFGTWITWFLLGGDLYTAYTFIAVPAAMFSLGAINGFFAVPYTIVAYPIIFFFMFYLPSKVGGWGSVFDAAQDKMAKPNPATGKPGAFVVGENQQWVAPLGGAGGLGSGHDLRHLDGIRHLQPGHQELRWIGRQDSGDQGAGVHRIHGLRAERARRSRPDLRDAGRQGAVRQGRDGDDRLLRRRGRPARAGVRP